MLSTRFHSFHSLTFLFKPFFSTVKYTKTHEWVKVNDKVATIGITDHIQRELGDIVFIDFPKVNTELQKGEVIAKIKSVKTIAKFYCPCKGKIIEVNSLLQKNILMKRCSRVDRWIVKIRVEEEEALKDIDKLLSEEQYIKHI